MIADFLNYWMPRAATLENPRFSLNDPEAYELLGGTTAESGVKVSAHSAMTLAPFWQAVSIISGDVATSTADVFRRTAEGDREVADTHPADILISTRPNEEMSAFELWRRFMVQLLIYQNGYLYVERAGGSGAPTGLYNLLPDRTEARRDDNGTLFYATEVAGRMEPLKKEQVIHVKGLCLDSGAGYDLVCAARNSIGLALAAEGFGSKFFANGAQAGGVVEVPPGTTEPAAERLMEGLKKKHTGKDNWFRVMVLRDGAKFHQTTIDAQKSQLTELREHQVRDIARYFNLPPHKLGLVDSVSYNSSEQSQIQYITGCLTHWFAALRGELQLKLLTDREQKTKSHFIDFNTSKLIERDLKTQVEILAIERQNEIINAAEWRRKRNLPPRTDAAAEEYVNPNTKSNGRTSSEPATTDKPQDQSASKSSGKQNSLSPAAKAVCEDALQRITRRVTAHARNVAKTPAKLLHWLDSRCGEHRDVFQQVVMPSALLAAEATGEDGERMCHAWSGEFFSRLVALLDPVTQPPHSASDIERNVDAECTAFESAVCADLLGTLIRSDSHAEVCQTAS